LSGEGSLKEIKLRKKNNIKRYLGFIFSAFKKTSHGSFHPVVGKSRTMKVIPSLLLKVYLFFKNIFLLMRLFYFELLYFAHLRVRYIHDILYKDNQTYKKVNDFRYTRTIRRATIWGVILSFFVSQILGGLWPNLFNPMHPQVAQGANTSVQWTTQGDFENNDISKGSNTWNTTRTGLDSSTVPNSIKIAAKPTVYNVQPSGNITTNSTIISAQYAAGGSGTINTNSVVVKLNTVVQNGCTVLAGSVSCAVSGLTSDTNYTVEVSANDNNGSSATGTGSFITPVAIATAQNIASPSGGSCSTFGTWDSGTSTCTFTKDVLITANVNFLSINSNNITVEGAGHTVTGFGSGFTSGINITARSGVTVKNLKVKSFNNGIYSLASSGVTIKGNTVQSNNVGGNGYGIAVTNTTGSNIYNNNFISNISQANAYMYGGSGNSFTQSAPSGGNYYDNFDTTGEGCSDGNSDGFCDATYSFTGGSDTLPWTAQNGWGPTVSNVQPADTISSSSTTVSAQYAAGGGSSINTGSVVVRVDGTVVNGCTVGATSVSCPVSGLAGSQTHYISGSVSDNNGKTSSISGSFTVNSSSYNTSATLGGSGGSDIGLRVDGGSSLKAKWSNADFALTSALVSGQGIKFLVRTSDDGSTWTIYDRNGSSVDPANMETAFTNAYYGQIYGGTNYNTISSSVPATRYAELIVRLVSDGSTTPTLDSATLEYNALESPASNVFLRKTDNSVLKNSAGVDVGSDDAGGWINESLVRVLTPSLTCSGCDTSTNKRPEVEIKEVGAAFDEALTYKATGSNNYVDVTLPGTPSAGQGYHIRVRSVDDEGRVSAWAPYSANLDPNGVDVSYDKTDPTKPGTPSTGSNLTDDNTPTWNWSASTDSDSDVGYYKVYWDDNSEFTSAETYTTNTNSFTHSSTLADGVWYTKVEAYDNAGNVSTVSDNGSVTVDTQAPSVFTLSAPVNNAWTHDNTPSFSWSESSDINGLAKYKLYIDGELDTDNIALTSAIPTGVLSGTHTWYVVAVDNAGNIRQSSTYTVKYDDQAAVPTSLATTSDDDVKVGVSWVDTSTGAPTQDFIVERVRKSDYLDNDWDNNPTSDWSTGTDYAVFSFSGASTSFNDSSDNPLQDQPLISQSVSYAYRIKSVDEAENTSAWSGVSYGRTTDTVAPSNPSVVSAISNGGYEVNLSWSRSTDAGSGVTGYKIYRRAGSDSGVDEDFTLVGYRDIEPPESLAGNLTWTDNDTNNDETDFPDTINEQATTIKPQTSPRLNDYVDYYYRVTAIDASGYESDVVTKDGFGIPTNTNFDAARTYDVTAPSAPTDLTVTAMGYDLGTDSQKIRVEWATSPDKTSRDSEVDGSGVLGYQVFRAGPYATETIPEENEYSSLGYTGATLYEDTGRDEMQYYYYKVKAIDRAHSDTLSDIENNISALTGAAGKKTLSNAVPNPPTSVVVESVKGSPSENQDIGSKVDITFSGAKIKWSANKITGYKIYRSETSPSSTTPPDDDNAWLSTATLLDTNNDGVTISDLNVTGYEPPDATGDVERTYTDTVPSDAQTYYYRIISVGYNPDQSPTTVTSGMTSVTAEVGGGWDKVPDATAPSKITNVEVGDLRDGEDQYRNIITWSRLSAALATNKRNGITDFKEYRIYRSTDGVLFTQILVDGENPLYRPNQDDAIDSNYYVDAISMEGAEDNYYYRVVAVDNAGSNFKYSNNTLVNAYDNESEPSTSVSINPSATSPTVTGVQVISVGVSTATIKWTTNQDTDSLVEYRVAGVNDVLASGKDRTETTKSHSVKLQGLEKNTTYEYRIISRNSLGNIDEEEADDDWNRNFKTDTFSISDNSVTPTTTTAIVKWTTNRASDSYVEYKLEGSSEKYEIAGDATMATSHEVILKALKSHSSYTYNLRSVTSDKYIATLNLENFRTRADDINKFVISPTETNMSEKNITATTAQITWTTTLPTTSWVEYGTRSGLYSMSAGDNTLGTVHAVKLQNLTPGTKYYYIVKGTDESNVEYFSPESSFTAVLMPEVSNLRVQDSEPYKAVITMDTNVEALVSINYGKDSGYGQRISKSKAERNHVIVLEGLEDNSTYHFQVSAVDQFKNEYLSEDTTFKTPLDTIGPEVSEVKVDVLPVSDSTDAASIIISWKTDKPATTQVEYDDKATGDKYDNQTVENKNLGTNHTVFIKDLSSSTNYRFRIVAKDKRGNLTQTKAATFITPTKEKSLLQVIIKSFEDTFSWVRNVPGFFGKVKDRVLGR